MKQIGLTLILAIPLFCFGQAENVKEIELTENHFALESQVIGLKAGFLKNMDSTAIGVNAKGFTNLFTVWSSRKESKSTLIWEPKTVYASEDGLWGSTHGPWYTRDSLGKLVNPGYFFTIWQRKNKGEDYKFSLDIGIQLDSFISAATAATLPMHRFSVPGPKNNKISPDTIAADHFKIISSSQSLFDALEKYAGPETAILVSKKGRIFKPEFKLTGDLQLQFQFEKGKIILLSQGSAFYEYGELKFINKEGKESKGQYVNIWILKNGRSSLLTALYKWE
jgi:hypothetical protein